MQSNISPVKREMLTEIALKDTDCFTHEDDFWDESVFASQLPDGHHVFLADASDSGVRGYICMMYVLDEAEVVRIGVFPPYRGLGLGERLLRAGIAQCAEKGAVEINLEVRQSNATARALYEKLGFLPVGRRKNYYPKENEDAILMKLILKEGAF